MSKHMPVCEGDDHPHNPESAVPRVSASALERASRLFRAMGDPARLRLLHLLAHREWCVTELVAALQDKFSTVSQRLRVLRSEGLIHRRRQGTHLYYLIADRHVADLLRNALDHAAELVATPPVADTDEGD
jgi:ArsR family transcriptional regulator, lead/cadmium/zinc/bismuth-responsive transcriptional repressor